MDHLRIQKTIVGYLGENLTVSFFSISEKALYYQIYLTLEKQQRVLRINDRFSFNESDRIRFEDITHFALRKTFANPIIQLTNIGQCYSLIAADRNRMEILIDEGTDIKILRRLGERCATITKTGLKVDLNDQEMYNARYLQDIRPWDKLNFPYIVHLNLEEKVKQKSTLQILSTSDDYKDIDVKKRFMDNTNTYFIDYTVPYTFDGPNNSSSFRNLVVTVVCVLVVFASISSPAFRHYVFDLGNIGNVILGFVALLGVVGGGLYGLFTYVILEKVELSINDKKISCKSSSLFNKTSEVMNTKGLEEFVVEKVEKTQYLKECLLTGNHEVLHLLSDGVHLVMRVDVKKAGELKKALNTAFREAGEKYLIDIKDQVVSKPSFYEDIEPKLLSL